MHLIFALIHAILTLSCGFYSMKNVAAARSSISNLSYPDFAARTLNFTAFRHILGADDELQILVHLNQVKLDYEKFFVLAYETFKHGRFQKIRPQVILYLKSLFDRQSVRRFVALHGAPSMTQFMELNLTLGGSSDEQFFRYLVRLEEDNSGVGGGVDRFFELFKDNPFAGEIIQRFSQSVTLYPFYIAHNLPESLWYPHFLDSLSPENQCKVLLALFKPEFRNRFEQTLEFIRQFVSQSRETRIHSQNQYFKLLVMVLEAVKPGFDNNYYWYWIWDSDFSEDVLLLCARTMLYVGRAPIFQIILEQYEVVRDALINEIGSSGHERVTLKDFILIYTNLEDGWKIRVHFDAKFYERIFEHFTATGIELIKSGQKYHKAFVNLFTSEADRFGTGNLTLVFDSGMSLWSKSISEVKSDSIDLLKAYFVRNIAMSGRNFSPHLLKAALESQDFRAMLKKTIFRTCDFPIRVTDEVVAMLDKENEQPLPVNLYLGNIDEYLRTVDSDDKIEALMRVTRKTLFQLHKCITHEMSAARRYYNHRYFYGYFIRKENRETFIHVLYNAFLRSPEVFAIDHPDLYNDIMGYIESTKIRN